MFNKILIANRGEIACRVIKTAKSLGVQTVAVYSDADQNSLHVQMADEAVYLGPSPSRESYLLVEKVIEAAKKTGAQAIHPGYGFLSENAEFCRRCEQENIVFIGPPVEAIEAMGSKSAAKTIMEKANVPLVPGYHGEDQAEATIKKVADDMGYPVLLKAAAGGGGKGMRQVWSSEEFSEAFAAAKREAISSFGDDTMLVEKYLTQPRHVEIQVFCDNHDNAVYLFERDCSVQRRHQKVIEEAPAFGMSEALRQQMGEAAIKAAKAINYRGAGTVEFLLDADGSFYFMEMNTRLQVEHPVTEFITGQDLVEWQLKVANNETLPKAQDELSIHGHAFEARIYAEDADNDFLPATGTLSYLKEPEVNSFIRVDTGVRQGDDVSVFYDPMIAKLIVWGENRQIALKRLTRALSEYRIHGVTTNTEFLYNLATCPAFINEDIDTGFIEKHHDAIFHNTDAALQVELPMTAMALHLEQEVASNVGKSHTSDPQSPWSNTVGWRLNQPAINTFTLQHGEMVYRINVTTHTHNDVSHYDIAIYESDVLLHNHKCQGSLNGEKLTAYVDGFKLSADVIKHDGEISLFLQNGVFKAHIVTPDLGDQDSDGNDNSLAAPMNGTVVEVLVNAGTEVTKGQALIIMEAMKMEHTIRAPFDGKVTEVFYSASDMVDGGAELCAFEASGDE